jgi:hypothetical protein
LEGAAFGWLACVHVFSSRVGRSDGKVGEKEEEV